MTNADGFTRRNGHDFTLPGAAVHWPPDLELDPVHLDLDAHVDLTTSTLKATVTTTFEARRAGDASVALDAVALEDVEVSDPDGHPLAWRYDGRAIRIRWAEDVAGGERRRVRVRYRVVAPRAGLYFSRPTEHAPDAPWYAVTDHETERARHWLPCIDQPSARPRLDLRLTADARFTILANGALIDLTDHGDGSQTAHWRLDWPCPSYLLCFVVGDLIGAEEAPLGDVPIAAFTTAPHTADDLRRSFGRTRPMLAWLNAKLGVPYPFAKYYQVALDGVSGAMENISLVTWDGKNALDETLALESTRLVDEINVHEMAHAWFGDAIVCRDHSHAWLKESWATYVEQLWFEDIAGEDERQYQFWRDADAYFEEADKRYMRPIVTREFNTSWQMYDRHLYPGGACRLHTLRRELGDPAFFAGLRHYVAANMGRVVETDDFRRAMEAASGRALGRFFDQWFHKPGYPKIKVTFTHDAKRGEGTFTLEQTQIDDKAGIPVFHLRSEVGWVVDGILRTAPAVMDGPRLVVVVAMTEAPEQVRFDPLQRVLHRLELNPGDALLRRQLTTAADVIGRIEAGRTLIATGTRANLEAVRAAYAAEPFWGVREALAAAMAKSHEAAAIEALADWAASERDPRCLAAVIRAAGSFRDPRIRDAIEARLDDGLPYHATAAAYEALGAQRDGAPLDRLIEAAERPSPYGIAQAGAFRGLAGTRRRRALDVLQAAASAGGSPPEARPAAVGALATLAAHQPRESRRRERIVELLQDLLRDPQERVRTAAVAGLETLGAPETAAALEAYRAPLAHQDQVRVDRALAAVRKAGGAPGAEERHFDELRAELRAMRERLTKLESRAGLDEGGSEGAPVTPQPSNGPTASTPGAPGAPDAPDAPDAPSDAPLSDAAGADAAGADDLVEPRSLEERPER